MSVSALSEVSASSEVPVSSDVMNDNVDWYEGMHIDQGYSSHVKQSICVSIW